MYSGGGSSIGLAGMTTANYEIAFNVVTNMVASADLYGDAFFSGAGVMPHINLDTDDGDPLHISRFRLRATQRDVTIYTRKELSAIIGNKPPFTSIAFRYHSSGTPLATLLAADFADAAGTDKWGSSTSNVLPAGFVRQNVLINAVIDSPTTAGTARLSTATPAELNSYAVGDKMEIPLALGVAVAGAGNFNNGKTFISAIDAAAGWVEFTDIPFISAVTVPANSYLQPVVEVTIVKANGGISTQGSSFVEDLVTNLAV